MRRSPLIIYIHGGFHMNYSKYLKQTLFSLVDEMEKESFLHVKDPAHDFVRNRKLSFSKTMKIILSMGGDNLRNEILSHFNFKAEAITTSAFCQQRSKIKYQAFETLFHRFNVSFKQVRKHRGYSLLACDGSAVRIPLETNDFVYRSQGGFDRYEGNYVHLNALYDICNKRYVDALIEPEHIRKEKDAFIQMIHRNNLDSKTVFIADRGYESYNVMAHIQSQSQFYLIRIKDNHKGGFAQAYPHPDSDEYDETYTRIFTRKRAKEYLDSSKYTFVRHKYTQDYFTSEHEMYEMTFRILRMKTSKDKYVCLVTNLSKEEFDANEIKELYKMRWGIETSFKELKYAAGLTCFHSKKEELIFQEIYARLILYNFCQSIALHIKLRQKKRKHTYQLNYTMAIKICRNFMKYDKAPPSDVEKLLEKELLPIRPGRNSVRTRPTKSMVGFLYRI